MPRQMLPPPTTTAISTPSSARASATSSATRCTTAASMPKLMVTSANASPDSLRTTREYWPTVAWLMERTLVLAHLHAGEPRELGVAAEVLDELGDADLRVLHGRLLEQDDVLVERVEPTLDRAFELGLRHALVAALLLDHRLLPCEHVGRDVVAGEVGGRRERDVECDLVRHLAGRVARRVDPGDLDQHRDGAALVLVVAVRVEEAVGLEAHDASEDDVLAHGAGESLDGLPHRGVAEWERLDVAIAIRRDLLGDVGEQPGEGTPLGDEVGVAVELDDDADVAVDQHVDCALGRLALAELARLGQALGPEDVERALGVAAGLLECVLAVEHRRAGRLADRGDVLGRVLSHSRSPGARWCPGRRWRRARRSARRRSQRRARRRSQGPARRLPPWARRASPRVRAGPPRRRRAPSAARRPSPPAPQG